MSPRQLCWNWDEMRWDEMGGEGRGGGRGGVSLNLIGQFGKMVLDLQFIHNMLEPTIDLELRPWPWILKVRVWNSYISGIGRANWHVTKGIWVHTMSDPLSELQLWPWPWIIKVKFWSRRILRMKWPIDIERKECQSIGRWMHYVTWNFYLSNDLDLGFSR